MTLDNALFRSAEPIAHNVTLPDGTTHALYFRQLPRKRFLAYWHAIEKAKDDDDAVDLANATLIAESLCEPDGSPAMSAERAMMLTIGAMQSISTAILVVNKMTKAAQEEAKNGSGSAENTGSGTSSLSH